MQIKTCPTVRPSIQEFNDFYEFVHKLDLEYKKDYGMVKIVPPPQWISRSPEYEKRLQNLMIKKTIEQNAQGKAGIFQSKNIIQKKIDFKNYKKYALEESKKCANKTIEQKEKLFWKTLVYSPPIYAADIPLTLMDEQSGSWNLNSLNSVLQYSILQKIKGVNQSYCYIGVWKSFFSWHKQDLDLAALNFIHEGQSKVWYSIAESDYWMLEQFAQKHFKNQYESCNQFMRHKTFLINPQILLRSYPEIKLTKMIRNQRQFMLVFGGAYHCGFNCGFNIAEAVNYATVDWFRSLIDIKSCSCSKRSVRAEVQSILYNLQNCQLYDSFKDLEHFQRLQLKVLEDQRMEQQNQRIKQQRQNKKLQKQLEKENQIKSMNQVNQIKGQQNDSFNQIQRKDFSHNKTKIIQKAIKQKPKKKQQKFSKTQKNMQSVQIIQEKDHNHMNISSNSQVKSLNSQTNQSSRISTTQFQIL